MNRELEKLPLYQRKMIARAGLTTQRMIALLALLDEVWEQFKNKPLSKALEEFTAFNVSRNEAFTLFTIYLPIKKKKR
jgi:hypothetical protein